MRPSPYQWRVGCGRRHRQGGFTLLETVLVIAILTLVSLGLLAMQPQVLKTQTTGRDQFVGLELMRACAERLLAVRRNVGYASVTNTLCNVIAGVGGFGSPTVALTDAGGTTIVTCSTATCTATISIAKPPAATPALTRLTLQLSAY